MQYAYEDLLSTVTGDGKSSYALKPVTTPAEDAQDKRRSQRRAEAHSKLNLRKLHEVLVMRRRACKTRLVKSTVDAAMHPLIVRLRRYKERARRAQERIDEKERRREEREFREMMENWVTGTNVETVESQLEDICGWQVEHAHQRDVARDKWRLRLLHQRALRAESKVPPGPLRLMALAVSSAFARPFIFPTIDEHLLRVFVITYISPFLLLCCYELGKKPDPGFLQKILLSVCVAALLLLETVVVASRYGKC